MACDGAALGCVRKRWRRMAASLLMACGARVAPRVPAVDERTEGTRSGRRTATGPRVGAVVLLRSSLDRRNSARGTRCGREEGTGRARDIGESWQALSEHT